MKKLLALTLAVLMVMSLAACGGESTDPVADKTDDVSTDAPVSAEPSAPRHRRPRRRLRRGLRPGQGHAGGGHHRL